MFIEYKAKLAGVKVVYVNPAYTSQTCPFCGNIKKVKDRTYNCTCGFRTHRDRLGTMNIIKAPVYLGKRDTASTTISSGRRRADDTAPIKHLRQTEMACCM
jgi:transposase